MRAVCSQYTRAEPKLARCEKDKAAIGWDMKVDAVQCKHTGRKHTLQWGIGIKAEPRQNQNENEMMEVQSDRFHCSEIHSILGRFSAACSPYVAHIHTSSLPHCRASIYYHMRALSIMRKCITCLIKIVTLLLFGRFDSWMSKKTLTLVIKYCRSSRSLDRALIYGTAN